MGEKLSNDYAYSLHIKKWVDSKNQTWFSGFALRSREKYFRGMGVASFGDVVDLFTAAPLRGSISERFISDHNLSDDVWVDMNIHNAKTKRELRDYYDSGVSALKHTIWENFYGEEVQ